MTVEGCVRLDGKAVERGAIRFRQDAAGPTATAMIEHGRYQLRALPGGQRIEIEAYEFAYRRPADPLTGAPEADVSRQIVPARYNSESTLHIDIGPRSEQHDFDLSSTK